MRIENNWRVIILKSDFIFCICVCVCVCVCVFVHQLYQRAVVLPIHALESLWKQYEAFENESDKLVAIERFG